jgi:hypothetical protein
MDKSEYMKQWRLDNPDKVKEYNDKAITNYSQGKIYRIVCNITGEQYYGSTKEKYLSRRLSRHKRNADEFDRGTKEGKCASYDIIKRGDFQIVLVETYPCDTKYELESRERYYIENNNCVNKTVPTRTVQEYLNDNKEIIRKKHKEYRERNKEIRAEKRNKRVICEKCGKESSHVHLKRHQAGKNCI